MIKSKLKRNYKGLRNLPTIYLESASNKTQNSKKEDGKGLKGIKKEWKVLKRIESNLIRVKKDFKGLKYLRIGFIRNLLKETNFLLQLTKHLFNFNIWKISTLLMENK